MHICFITNEYPKKGFPHGGIGSFVKTVSDAYAKRKHDVSIVGINTYENKEEIIIDGHINIYRLKAEKVKGVTWFLNSQMINKLLRKIHSENPIDIVEASELGLAFTVKLPKVSYVIRLHGGHHFFSEAENRSVNWWKGWQERRSFKKADAFIAVSNYVKEHTQKYLSYQGKQLSVISSPINLDIFKPLPDIEVDSETILFAGTICEKKGIKHLLLAMKRVFNHFPNSKLVIYGRDWFFKNGESYTQYLKDKILPQLEEFSKNVAFKGVISMEELSKQYASSALCVFPSLMETQGLVAQEAMATNKLVVFSECGPGSEAIKHKVTGLLCNPYKIDSISENILWALNNSTESTMIAENARSYIVNNYNVRDLIDKNIEFYKSVL